MDVPARKQSAIRQFGRSAARWRMGGAQRELRRVAAALG
jgi:hypothetical protein